jgi:hypothetical protein
MVLVSIEKEAFGNISNVQSLKQYIQKVAIN